MPGWNGLSLLSYQVSFGTYRFSTKTSFESQFSGSRGSQSPRSRIRIRLPDGARCRASVPPPAPLPMMMTSYRPSLAMIPSRSSVLCAVSGGPRPRRDRLVRDVVLPDHPGRSAPVERLWSALLAEEVDRPALERADPIAAAGHERGMDAQPRS